MENSQPPLSPELPVPAAPSAPSYPAAIFVSPNGLRAGWRFLLFNLIWGLSISAIVGVISLFVRRPKGITALEPLTDIVQEVIFLTALVLTLLIMHKIEHRGFSFDWLPKRNMFGRNFWVGSVWGFCALFAQLLMMRGLNDFYFGPLALHGLAIAKYAVLWAIGFTLVGLFEESFSRGYGFRALANGIGSWMLKLFAKGNPASYNMQARATAIGFWATAIITSCMFGAMHLGNSGEERLGIASVVAVGLVLSFTLWRTGSLWFAVGLHFGWDYAETFFFGTPDSGLTATGHLLSPTFQGSHWITGGSVGPEGSVLVFVVYGLLTLALHFAYPKRKLALDFSSPMSAPEPGAQEGTTISAA